MLHTAQSPDEDIGKKFVEFLESELDAIHKILDTEIPIKMTPRDEKDFRDVKKCYACGVKIGNDKEKKVRDHCHLTGKYRGASCNSCNLRMRVPKFIPVLFHNLEGYDSHLFVKSLGYNTNENIRCIPKTDEKYISLSKGAPVGEIHVDEDGKEYRNAIELRFLDSLKFTQSSLDKLAENLREDQFKALEKEMGTKNIRLLRRKGVFPGP